jgi:hypothetical protein
MFTTVTGCDKLACEAGIGEFLDCINVVSESGASFED